MQADRLMLRLPAPGRPRDERGAVAVVVAVMFASVLLGLAAIGVDTARWYLERERVQRAADAAALAGVVYLPDNLSQAIVTARNSARLNGYAHNPPETVVDVEYGERRSRLRVTITTTIPNQFGRAINVDTATISRTAVADYTSPAPMGSPCNAFGNEPQGGNNKTTGYGASGPRDSVIPPAYKTSGICRSDPNFWAAIEGPTTDKQNGDRYGTGPCTLRARRESDGSAPSSWSGAYPYGCQPPANTENVFPEGYFYSVKVPQSAVGSPITVQLFDPAFFNTGANCSSMPNMDGRNYVNNLNPYSTDSYDSYFRYTDVGAVAPDASASERSRYQAYSRLFCTGDSVPVRALTAPATVYAPTTSFTVRAANDSQDPMAGTPYSGCTAQFRGYNRPTLAQLTRGNKDYQDHMARLFHQWVPLCTFTPQRAGDHYLQVRTNVALGGTEATDYAVSPAVPTGIWRDNPAVLARAGNTTTGEGVNAFAIRALSSKADQISVSGWTRMPMFQNVPDSTATFNLLRVLPGAAGQSIAFEFYDVADGSSDRGTVQVVPPKTASGTQPGPYSNCRAAMNGADLGGSLSACTVDVRSSTHNGQVQRMSIPIQSDYTCRETELTGCWFTVKISMSGPITDFTTWDASLQGDPIRLVE